MKEKRGVNSSEFNKPTKILSKNDTSFIDRGGNFSALSCNRTQINEKDRNCFSGLLNNASPMSRKSSKSRISPKHKPNNLINFTDFYNH